jgi:hypothetical protein
VDIARQQQLQQSIAARIIDALSGHEWASVTVLWSEIGLNSYSRFGPRDAAGGIVDIRIPRYDDDFETLRAEMANPETGAWYSAELVLSPDGSTTFRFNYTERVYWHGKPGDPPWEITPRDQDYLDDLEQCPRDPRHIPDWLPTAVGAPGAGEGAAVEALLARPLTLPGRLEPLRSAWGWPDVLASIQAAIEKNVLDAADEISLDQEYRPRLARILEGLLEFVGEDVHERLVADRPVSELQRLWVEAAPIVGRADERTSIRVGMDTRVRDSMDDRGVSDLWELVFRVVTDIATADLESRFGVRPAA